MRAGNAKAICANCRFFETGSNQCHRMPPTAVLAPSSNRVGPQHLVPSSMFAPTTPDTWCGEFIEAPDDFVLATFDQASDAKLFAGGITWVDPKNRRS